MTVQKPTRLAQTATYFNVSRDEIVSYLIEKGLEIQDNPNAKIGADAFKVLNEKYSSEHELKEESNQFLSKAQTKEAEEEKLIEDKKKKEEAEIAAALLQKQKEEEEALQKKKAEEEALKKKEEEEKAKEIDKVEETPLDKITIDKPELKGLKVLGNIDISNKKKETPKKEVAKVEKEVAVEKPIVKKEEIKVVPPTKIVVEEEKVEHIETNFQKIGGLKKMGTIEVKSFERKKEKPADKKKEDPKSKKRSRINETTPDKKVVVFDNQDKSKFNAGKGKKGKGKNEKTEKTEGSINSPSKTIPSPRNLRQKFRKKKREEHAEKAQLEAGGIDDKILKITEFVSISEMANLMNLSATDIISFCFSMGVVASINQRLDAEIIELIASEYDYEVQFISLEDTDEMVEEEDDNPEDLETRAPIVTIMGHVDHGKTSLLDYIRNENVAKKEAGGITQHIGAYDVKVPKHDRKITFIDTPGHEAFTAMRARGAKLTDIAVIVIAADDKLMPQTREAISHSQSASVPMIFAINKIDKEGANPEGVRTQLSEMNLLVESWGGKIQDQEISAKTGQGIDELLEKILFESDLLELKANPKKLCNGTVIEASLDKGRGYVATVLVLAGTLNVGDFIVAGSNYGKVKAMYNHLGEKLKTVLPGEPVQILGLNGAPTAGETIKEFKNEQDAKSIATKRSQIIREQGIRTKKHITLDEIGRRLALGTFKELNLIVKGDVDGSVQALSDSLTNLSTPEIQVNILHKAIGAITESDVLLASASDAIILGFQVRPTAQAKTIADRESIDIRHYSVIYQAIDEIKSAMEGMLEPTTEEKIIGNLEIKEIFKISKIGTIAGCFVTDGKIKKSSKVRVVRDGIVIHTGTLASLKRFKDDVKEVVHGQDCGMNLDNFNDIQVGDILEGFEEVEIKRTLS